MSTNNPIITASVVDTNTAAITLTGDNKKLIKYVSNAYAEMSVTAQNGAAINEDMYIIRNGSNTGYGKTHTFNSVESNEFIFSAEDSNGNIGTATVTPTMVPYVYPTCYFSDNKISGNGTMTVECWGAFYNGSFGAVTNTLTVKYRYSDGGSYSSWYNMSVTKNGNSYTASATLTGLDYKKKYLFDIEVTDKIFEIGSVNNAVDSAPIFHWGKNDFAFEVPVAVKGGFDVTGDVRIKQPSGNNIAGYGDTLFFGDGDEAYIANDGGIMSINAEQIDLQGTVHIDGSEIGFGSWTPTLGTPGAISSYIRQNGWYSKIGQIVTVGFDVKADCKEKYSDWLIGIDGLPFKPLYQAAGGGMCSGAYVVAGANFQCFVAETSGTIKTRVQACNNTEGKNLTTSAAGLFYPTGGGELTVSGTITYFADWE